MSVDPLRELLAPESLEAPFRQALRERTSRLVRRRRWRRRLLASAAALACFGAGMASMAWLQRAAPGPDPVPIAAPRALPPPAPDVSNPLALEWQAFGRPPKKKAEELLEAGDRYLSDDRDFDSALRCYRQALAGGNGDLLEIAPEDNWLVMALKLDRKER